MSRLDENKRGQTEFGWIFSLIIGALIIFLAIFFSSRYIQTSTFQSDIEVAREFDILLNPFASIGSVTTMTLSKEVSMPVEMDVNFTCNSDENYESMTLKTKNQKSFSEGVSYKIRDKYIFSENLQGKRYWIFSKTLEMPWRVDDLIYIVSDNYCFVNPPERIKKEVSDLGNERVSLNCEAGSRRVCFNTPGCEINVDYSKNIVTKNRQSLPFYGDSLMYAAVFSDNSLYKCTLNRIMSRMAVQTDINMRKAEILSGEGCETRSLQSSLISFKASAERGLLMNLGDLSNELKAKNPQECPVW